MKKQNCDGCDKCCRYVALEIDAPENKEDYDQIRWFLTHKDVWIFIDHDDSWNIQFNTPCEKLSKSGKCTIYEKRPIICRKYSTDNCEKFGAGDSFKLLWKNIEEFEEWFEENTSE
jgi:uncharacterized protein